jgi:hypothetical protein
MSEIQPGILFRIEPSYTRKIAAWVEEIDWQILKSSIEKRGGALALDWQNTGQSGFFKSLTEMPTERGRYRPHYGDFGGGFEYSLHPSPGFIAVKARTLVKDAYGQEFAPFEFSLPGRVETSISKASPSGLYYPHDSRLTDGETKFGFSGEFYAGFRTWEWYSEDLERYDFQFYPLSVGCLIHVIDLEQQSLLDLTKDIEW